MSIRLDDEAYGLVVKLSKETGLTMSEIVRNIVKTYPMLFEKAEKFDRLVTIQAMKELERIMKDGGEEHGA